MKLDLHEVKHADVKQLLDTTIYQCMNKKCARLYVITGNSDEMRRIVVDVAKDYYATAVQNMFNTAEIILDF